MSEDGSPKPPRLLEQVRDAVRRKHYSYRTEQTYLHWIKRYIWFHDRRHPAEMGAAEVTAFLTHLAREREVAAATQNQALSALLFLYGAVLQVKLPWMDGIRARQATGARPSRADSGGGAGVAGEAGRHQVADGGAALRLGVAIAGVPEAAREGRGLRVSADHGT